MSTCDVFNRSFHGMYKMKFSCYSWLVCLLGFWLRNTSLVKAGNPISDGMVFVLRLAWCVHVRRGLKVWSDTAGLTWYLSGAASRMVSLSNYCIDVCFFNSNLMKPSVVFMWLFRSCTFVRFETTFWPSIRFDISLKKFKKPIDIFSLQIDRKGSKEYLVMILAVKESFERFFCLEFIFDKANTGKPA